MAEAAAPAPAAAPAAPAAGGTKKLNWVIKATKYILGKSRLKPHYYKDCGL